MKGLARSVELGLFLLFFMAFTYVAGVVGTALFQAVNLVFYLFHPVPLAVNRWPGGFIFMLLFAPLAKLSWEYSESLSNEAVKKIFRR